MIIPQRAPVRPRVKRKGGDAAFLLEDEIAELVRQGRRGIVLLRGNPGSGRTTALQHLASVLAPTDAVMLLDKHESGGTSETGFVSATLAEHTLVVTAASVLERQADIELELAPWGCDEWIEFLLARYPEQCKSVMARLLASQENLHASYTAEVWRVVLEEMAADETVASPLDAMICRLSRQFTREQQLALSPMAMDALRKTQVISWQDARQAVPDFNRPAWRLLNQPLVISWIAAAYAAKRLKESRALDYDRCLHNITELPRRYVLFLTMLARGDEELASELFRAARSRAFDCHATAVSVLHLAGSLAPPAGGRPIADSPSDNHVPGPCLSGGLFEQANWPGADLRRMDLYGADFSQANLRQARLTQVSAGDADFTQADLREAALQRAQLREATFVGANLSKAKAGHAVFARANCQNACFNDADLSGADFGGANLEGASFRSACVSAASLRDAQIEGADFTRANLSCAVLDSLNLSLASFREARFMGASCNGCVLEGMDLPTADCERADFSNCTFTGASMPRANFRSTILRGCGLADVDWEGADLRDADFRGAVFSMGGSRSGLVGSPYPGHGTRTGFYTDDYNDLSTHKHPEEIRKANLCGADLRGANIEGVDFYLVDLRGAFYDRQQAGQLRRCGAILREPVT